MSRTIDIGKSPSEVFFLFAELKIPDASEVDPTTRHFGNQALGQEHPRDLIHKPRHLPWLFYGSPSLVDECFEIEVLGDDKWPVLS